MSDPVQLLEEYYNSVSFSLSKSYITDTNIRKCINDICRCNSNKAPIRFLMSCLLAKIDRPAVDIRKPYTEIDGEDTFSGRFYDEQYVEKFIYKYKLPCNPTTAYLTPAFRNINRILIPALEMEGRPKEIYKSTLLLLDLVSKSEVKAKSVLKEIIRCLLVIKNEDEQRMNRLIMDLKQSCDFIPLSSEDIITLLTQHLNCKGASRLPVLIVAAAYISVGTEIGEKILPLSAHTAADKQTGSLGDIQITLTSDDKIVTTYEMKDKKVTKNDIDHAIQKLAKTQDKIDNYIFITTDSIEYDVEEYAKSLYAKIGIEFALLNCIGFLRHFLHFFHRQRTLFLDQYQDLLLNEPISSVSQPLKEAFLALRKASETDK